MKTMRQMLEEKMNERRQQAIEEEKRKRRRKQEVIQMMDALFSYYRKRGLAVYDCDISDISADYIRAATLVYNVFEFNLIIKIEQDVVQITLKTEKNELTDWLDTTYPISNRVSRLAEMMFEMMFDEIYERMESNR